LRGNDKPAFLLRKGAGELRIADCGLRIGREKAQKAQRGQAATKKN